MFPEKRDVALGKTVTAFEVDESSAVTSFKPSNATMTCHDSCLAIDLGQNENVDRVNIDVAAGMTRYCFNIPGFNQIYDSY